MIKPLFLPSRLRTKAAALLLLFSGIHFGVLHAADPAMINVGTAAGYGVLAGSTVTSTGPTVIKGNVGLSPGSAVTGFPPGLVNGVQNIGNGAALQAKTDLNTAYNQAAGLAPNVVYAAPVDLVGLTLAPGVYKGNSSIGLGGTLVLDAQGVSSAGWVFQAGSTLIAASGSKITLINGAQACHVFWQVGSSATLGTASDFKGVIMALTSITLNTGATLEGAALAQNGAVTLDSNVITVPDCLIVVVPEGGVLGPDGVLVGPEGGIVIIVLPPTSFTEFAQTPNQVEVATALDSFRNNPNTDQLSVLLELGLLTPEQYAAAFDSISPTLYQSLGTIAFNQANAQNMQLVQRLWGQRVAESGFSMSGLPENTPVWNQGKSVVDSKNSTKEVFISEPEYYRWSLFVDGNGIFSRANSASMLQTYDAESGGVTTGCTYRWNDYFTTGVYAGYQGTSVNYGDGSTLLNNSVRFGMLGTYGQRDGKGVWVTGLVGGGYNDYRIKRTIAFNNVRRTAHSSPGAGELDTMLATGYDFKMGNWTFGPTVNAQYTYLAVNSFNETGADSLNINAQDWNTSSLLSTVGAQAAYTWMATPNIAVVPQINLGWQHEFMQDPYTINSTLNGSGPTFGNTSSAPIRDYLYTGIGATVAFGKRWNTSLFYNASLGNSDLASHNIFLAVGLNF